MPGSTVDITIRGKSDGSLVSAVASTRHSLGALASETTGDFRKLYSTIFSNDAVHDSGWRPQGAAYDMGALELAAAGKRRPPIAAGGRMQCY